MMSDRNAGSAVVLVLVVILLVSGSLFASTFLVGLESRAAGAAGSALRARHLSQSAIGLAVAEIAARTMAGAPVGEGPLGPWPGDVPRVDVSRYTAGHLAAECGCLYTLSTIGTAGVADSAREVVIAVTAAGVSVWSRR